TKSKGELKFDSSGNITSRSDLNKNTTEYTYTSGNLTKITRQDGREITLAYSSGQLSTITDWAGRVTTLTHNGSDQITRITTPDPDAAGPLAAAETDFTYDSGNQMIKTIVDPRDNTTTFNYDAFDRLSSVVHPGSDTYTYAPQVVQGMVASGGGTSGSPASLPAATPRGSVTDPLSNTVYVQFDPLGFELEVEDALGNVTTWERNDAGYPTKLTAPDPDGAGPLASPVTEFEYDDANNLTKVTYPDLTTKTWEYDTDWNRPTKFTDADGNVTNYTVDSSGNFTQVERIIGAKDDAFNGETDDIVTSMTYTSNPTAVDQLPGGMILTMTDPRGNVTDVDYGTNNLLTSFGQITVITFADGTGDEADVSYTYDSDYLLATEVDELSNTTSYTYDDLGRLTEITYPDPDGLAPAGPLDAPIESFAYDVMNQLTEFTDALGNVTSYTYDSRSRLATTTLPDPDGVGSQTASVTTLAYDAAGRLSTITDALGYVTTYGYDAAGRQTSVTLPDPDGAGSQTSPVTSYAYDNMGRLTSVTDPLSRVTTFEYDVMSRQTSMTLPDPDGAGPATAPEWSSTYTSGGQLATTTDPLGNVTTLTYDDANRLIQETFADPDGAGSLSAPEVDYEYDTAGNLVAVTSAIGAVTSFTYDARNRRTQTTLPDPDGAGSLAAPTLSWVYDDAGRVTSATDSLGSVTTPAYDNLGRLTGRTLPDPDGTGPQQAAFESFEYNAAGWMTKSTDPLSNVTDYAYDNLGRATEVQLPDPDGAGSLGRPTTTYAYDKLGRRTSLTDSESNVTSWAYDGIGRMTSETDPLSEVTSYTYDAASRLTEMTDRRGLGTEFNYDDLDRLTSEVWKDGATTVRTLTFAYDAIGNLTSASDPSASYSYTYDNLHRATQTEIDFGTGIDEFRLTSVFDASSRRTSLGLEVDSGSGWTDDLLNTYTFDDLGRVTSLTQDDQVGGATVQEKRVDFTYTIDGRFDSITRYKAVVGGTSNEVATTDYVRDDLGRITSLEHTHSSTSIADYDFTYDRHNRIIQIAATSSVGLSGTTDFTYDTTGQLTEADHTHISDEAYSYDENGNRTNTGYTTGTDNRMTSDGVFNYTYDDNGNRITRTRISTDPADDKTTEYDWDHRNRLTAIREKNNSGTITNEIAYEYDIYNRRVSKSVDDDGAGSAAAEVTRFVYDGGDILAVTDSGGDITHRMLHGPAVDQILAIEDDATSEVLWSLTDHLGSVRDIVDSDGNVENHIVYDSYGNVVSETDAAVDFLYGFTGRERGEESGLNYHRARYYDTATGRWLSNDPIGFAAGDTNVSRYVQNNPVSFKDSSGLVLEQGEANPDPVGSSDRMWTHDPRNPPEFSPTETVRVKPSFPPLITSGVGAGTIDVGDVPDNEAVINNFGNGENPAIVDFSTDPRFDDHNAEDEVPPRPNTSLLPDDSVTHVTQRSSPVKPITVAEFERIIRPGGTVTITFGEGATSVIDEALSQLEENPAFTDVIDWGVVIQYPLDNGELGPALQVRVIQARRTNR
ncbi:MAG: RHS repeat-associated core domain-containing protein, partial [Planctomycetota bacterium]